MTPNLALRRTAASRSGRNRRGTWPRAVGLMVEAFCGWSQPLSNTKGEMKDAAPR
jgi:hypothetical protein